MGNEKNELVDILGSVKWFDPRKGFGFIVGPENQDIFVHYTVIQGDGFRVLADGAAVVYSAENGDKGWRATCVVLEGGAASDTDAEVESESENDPENESENDHENDPEVVVPKRTYSRTPRR